MIVLNYHSKCIETGDFIRMKRKRMRMKKRMKKAQKRKYIFISFLAIFLVTTFSFVGIKVSAHLKAEPTISAKIEAISNNKEEIVTKPNDTEVKDSSLAFQDGKEVEGGSAVDATETGTLPTKQKSKDKIAYLTFDDGPTKNITPQVLKTLKDNNVKATFFVIGKMVQTNPDILKQEYNEGHLIANHSYSHDYQYIYKTVDNFKSDMKKSEDLIKNTLNIDSKIKVMRFPGGSFPQKLAPFREAIIKDGYYPIDWNCLNEDAQGGKKTKEQLLESVIQTSKGKNEIVILMHDAATKQTTADALDSVIKYLSSEGYKFDTLNNYYK